MAYLSVCALILSSLYVLVSIVIELINIILLLTPSEKDDSFGKKLLDRWESISKYIKWFTIKTPILIIFGYILSILIKIREKLQEYVVKRRERKTNSNKSNKVNDANL